MFEFHKILTVWYQQNKRDLPWREKNDPYFIWVSEIILQQTRVDQGKDYFTRFIGRFPDIYALAGASENEVLKIWQGLGYYSRARNMHFAAKQIINEFNGAFPDNHSDLLRLKGVGDYTAAAIASIAFGQPHAVIDGNVYRVLSRIFGLTTPVDSTEGKREFSDLAHQLLDRENPAVFNEAMMELGALQCTPRNPECNRCPFQQRCVAFNLNKINTLPVKTKKTKVRNRYFYYLYILHNENIFMEKREQNDIWQNLYQLPLIESSSPLTIEELLKNDQFKSMFNCQGVVIEAVSDEIIHILTHQRLHVRFIEIRYPTSEVNPGWISIPPDKIADYPVPKLIDNFLLGKRRFKRKGNPKI
jgi:A/G-specific adenine glycosylase